VRVRPGTAQVYSERRDRQPEHGKRHHEP